WLLAQNRVAHVLVVIAIVAESGSESLPHESIALGSRQNAPVLLRLRAPRAFSRNLATPQVHLLRIESLLHERACRSIHEEPRTRSGRQHCRTEDGTSFSGVVERDIERVIDDSAVAFQANIGGDRLRYAKQNHRVVDQVRPEIEENAGARPWLFAPGVLFQLWAVTVVVGLE